MKASKEVKWTKGPWRLDRRSEHLVGYEDRHVSVYGAGLSFAGLPTDETVANARLITQAPALYAALELSLPHLEYKRTHVQTATAMKAVARDIEAIKAAMKLARGDAQ